MMNDYVAQKLRELDEERLTRVLAAKHPASEPIEYSRRSRPVVGPVLRAAGRTLRSAGQRLEGWAAPEAADGEQRLGFERRRG
jgi:hypothetical protein